MGSPGAKKQVDSGEKLRGHYSELGASKTLEILAYIYRQHMQNLIFSYNFSFNLFLFTYSCTICALQVL